MIKEMQYWLSLRMPSVVISGSDTLSAILEVLCMFISMESEQHSSRELAHYNRYYLTSQSYLMILAPKGDQVIPWPGAPNEKEDLFPGFRRANARLS